MREIDFLRGRPAANLACFALPALGANLLQSADQVVDMLVMGAFVGERGLAALANATMVGFVANSLSLGLAVGATVLVSRRLGAGERDGASRAEGAALLVAIALSAAVALPCALLAAPLYAALGVAGTAWSSTAASSLAAALSLAVLAKRRGSTLPARPAARDLAGLARVAAPAAFQQVVVNLSYLAITSMTNALGTAVVAGAGAATKASTLAGMSVWSAGQAVSAAAARCEDAGDRRRALAYARAGLAVSVGGHGGRGPARPSVGPAARCPLRRRPRGGGRGRALPARLLLGEQPRLRRHVRARLLCPGDPRAEARGGQRPARRRGRPRGARRPARARPRLPGHPRRPGALAGAAVRRRCGVPVAVCPQGEVRDGYGREGCLMRYANARDVLPEPLVRELQKVVQGGYLYVPKDEHSRKRWGEESGYREELEARNRRICEELDSGMSVGKLAER